ncbi:MAG TPA: cobalamin biosynthesis protein [Pilimelia sp.]|nr:cobalamin biosynthesis protein [Pilimelia sp.]
MTGPAAAAGDRPGRAPAGLVVGVGARRGVSAAELAGLVDAALADAELPPSAVRALATVEARAGEPGIRALARARGWPLLAFPADLLAAESVPGPAERVRAAVGTPSVAEAAALRAARAPGGGAELVVGKRAAAACTVAVARSV